MSSSITCQHCGCSEIDIDQARGDAVCTNCGLVLEDNIIVSEVQFEETGHGGTSAIGQFVSADGKMPSCFSGGFHHGIGKESRLITLQNGKKKIVQLSQQLRLNQHCIDTAFNFFKMAVARKLTKGRKNSHVIAACVYMVCRTEGTPHMLLDFSDIVQVNVYDLGRTFLRLSSALCINIPTIDPCLFIMRFAHKLEFGDKTHEVSMTALRLVQRMKRDWMHTGRRPSGLCGAALLVAARLHDFNRTTKDIIKVVKVCGSTLRKRLTEFGDTPSSRLTLDEFMSIDLEEEQDPPAFKAARRKQKVLQLEEQTQVEEVTQEITELQRQIERALEERHKKLRGRYNNYVNESGEDEPEEVNDLEAEEDTTKRFVTQETIATIKDFLKNDEENSTSLPTFDEKLRPTAASLGLTDSLEDCMKNTQEVEEEEENGELDLTGIDDAELDYYIMTDTEVQRKTNLWTKINAEYLKEMQEKEEREAKEKEEGISKPDKKKRKIAKKKNQAPATTAGEAIEKMLQEKKISSKINYEVLRNLNKISEDKQPVSVERVETANPICFLEKNEEEEVFLNTNSKRLPSIRGFKNKKMKLAVCPIEEPPSTKEVVLEEVVIESDPVQYASAEPDHDEDGADDFYDEDGHVSAAQLFGMRNAVDDDYGEDFYDDS